MPAPTKFISHLLLAFFPLGILAQTNFPTRFEMSGGEETATYEEGIGFYQQLAGTFPEIQITEQGPTDCGKPLHLITLSLDQDFDFSSLHAKEKAVLLVNNAIHPGEPDGVDASMMFLRDLMLERNQYQPLLKDVAIAVVPFYNIGGVLNRNSTSRANQNGPKEYGFRGNGRNYDLNRDFIKADTLNARSFTQLFHKIDPDIFVDTHVSNGADYPYVMTIDITQKDKLGGPLAVYLEETMMPFLYESMEIAGAEMIPYVNIFGDTPENGYSQFFDSPRYSSGYTALFHTLGFMTETHMLKGYRERVWATYHYLMATLKVMHRDRLQILQIRQQTKEMTKAQSKFDLAWELDESRHTPLRFKGYKSEWITSEVTGQKRLRYDRQQTFNKQIPYANHYRATVSVSRPDYYLIPQSWRQIIDRLRLNQVRLETLSKDTTYDVEVYHIEDYQTLEKPYEGHYLHRNVKLRTERATLRFRKGDVRVPVNQWRNRYIVETLEPQGIDSFFAWNFFDTILQRKEGYSDYVFEDEAAQLLATDSKIREAFETKRRNDSSFASDGRAQLDFIYRRSPRYEAAHLRYPIYRVPAEASPQTR